MPKQNIFKVLTIFLLVFLIQSCNKDDNNEIVNNAPTIKTQSFSISEAITESTVIGRVIANDPDDNELSFGISKNSSDLFVITKDGAISLVIGKKLDFETSNNHEITVQVSDGISKASAIIIINVTDVDENEAPEISSQEFSTDDNIDDTKVIGVVIASDPNDDTLTYNVTGEYNTLFQIDNSGAITLINGQTLDFETQNSYALEVIVSDGILSTTAVIIINITRNEGALGFITTWRTGATNESITIPTQDGFNYDYSVDWGDGSSLTSHTANAIHTYEAAGTYTITITGIFPSIYFSNNNETKNKILSIEQWGAIEWQSMKNAFEGCNNLTYNATDAPNLSLVTDMGAMFRDAPSFNAEDLNSWNVSNVTNMRSMFLLTPFDGNISTWDVSNVTDMSAMFFGTASFNNDISTWDVSSVIEMSSMFSGASSFNQDLSNWNTIKVIDCFNFNENSSLASNKLPTTGPCFSNFVADSGLGFITTWQVTSDNESIQIPITSGDVTIDWGDGTKTNHGSYPTHTYAVAGTYDVTITGIFSSIYFADRNDKDKIMSITQWGDNKWETMEDAFSGCSNLTISATDAPDLSAVTDMSSMFSKASSFNGDIGFWDVSNVSNMESMFYEATSFNGDISNWDVSKVTNMALMFFEASSFNGDISNWDVSRVTNMSVMFLRASLFNSNISAWDVSNVTTMPSMFHNASSFNSDISNWNVSNVTDMRSMFNEAVSFNSDISNWNVGNVTTMSFMFYKAGSFNSDISRWNVGSVTDMSRMFHEANSFNSNLANWDVGQVTDMAGMFLSTPFNNDISNWNVSNVISMNAMFYFADSFNSNISNWNVANVENVRAMFNGASSFNQDLTNWNVGKVSVMSQMFFNATSFNGDISNWNVSNVVEMGNMFFNSAAFNSDISNWDVSKVNDMFRMFNGAATFNQNLSNWNTINVTDCRSFGVNSALTSANLPTVGSCF